MRDGRILQCDSPQQLYARPNDVFIAAFIGSPAMNLVEASYDAGRLRFGQYALPVERAPQRDRLILGIRPEAFRVAASSPSLPTVEARVEVVEELGSDTHVFFGVDAPPMTAEVLEAASEEGFLADRALFTARVDAGATIRVGDVVPLAVDVDRLHYFDADTGARLDPATEQVAAIA
jgi:multiple sugar transport system ATP-binding protein